jgi:AP endonuclease 1
MARATVRRTSTPRGKSGVDLDDERGGKGKAKVKADEPQADIDAASVQSDQTASGRGTQVKKEPDAKGTTGASSPAAQEPRKRASRRTSSAPQVKVEVKVENGKHEESIADDNDAPSPAKGKARASRKRKVEVTGTSAAKQASGSETLEAASGAPKKRRKLSTKAAKEAANGTTKEESNAEADPKTSTSTSAEDSKPKRKSRRAPPLRASDITPIRPRNTTSQHWIGAHVSSAGGPHNALLNALKIGANAVAMFVRPKMQWASKPMAEESVEEFKDIAKSYEFGVDSIGVGEKEALGKIVPHGCYLINLGNPDQEKKEKAIGAFFDDLRRCHQLGVKLYNFHPGVSLFSSSSTAS